MYDEVWIITTVDLLKELDMMMIRSLYLDLRQNGLSCKSSLLRNLQLDNRVATSFISVSLLSAALKWVRFWMVVKSFRLSRLLPETLSTRSDLCNELSSTLRYVTYRTKGVFRLDRLSGWNGLLILSRKLAQCPDCISAGFYIIVYLHYTWSNTDQKDCGRLFVRSTVFPMWRL